MSQYLDNFGDARTLVLPGRYLPRDLPRPAGTKKAKDVVAETYAHHVSREMMRVNSQLLPSVERAVDKACFNLRLRREQVHAFVTPKTDGINAFCFSAFDEPVIVFGSQIIELMTEEELCFVAGHELGHFLLPEAHSHEEDKKSPEGRLHSRAAELSMDRIGTIACGDPKAACNASMKLMCGLREPHLRTDVSAILAEARSSFNGTFHRHEEQSTHPPAPNRLWSILQFSMSDAFLCTQGKSGGTPIAQINNTIGKKMLEQVDGRTHKEITEPVRMAKAWLYCLCRSHGQEPDLRLLNEVGPAVEPERLQKAWDSLVGFKDEQLREHAHKRMTKAAENAFQRAPHTTRQFFVFVSEESRFSPIHHLLSL